MSDIVDGHSTPNMSRLASETGTARRDGKAKGTLHAIHQLFSWPATAFHHHPTRSNCPSTMVSLSLVFVASALGCLSCVNGTSTSTHPADRVLTPPLPPSAQPQSPSCRPTPRRHGTRTVPSNSRGAVPRGIQIRLGSFWIRPSGR